MYIYIYIRNNTLTPKCACKLAVAARINQSPQDSCTYLFLIIRSNKAKI